MGVGDASGKEPACQCRRHEMWVRSLGQKDSLADAESKFTFRPVLSVVIFCKIGIQYHN